MMAVGAGDNRVIGVCGGLIEAGATGTGIAGALFGRFGEFEVDVLSPPPSLVALDSASLVPNARVGGEAC